MENIRQILLALPTYPDPIPSRSLEGACALAQIFGAGLTAQIPELNEDSSTWPAVVGAFPLDFPQMMARLVDSSQKNAATTTTALLALCKEFGVRLDVRRCLATLYPPPELLVDLARLHDLVVLPTPETDSFDRPWTVAAIFGSGKPVLLLPSDGRRFQTLNRVSVAWDYSREAARALSDALPLLARATKVHIITVVGEKHMKTSSAATDLEKYLTAHDIRYEWEKLEIHGRRIGRQLMERAREMQSDLLVMGAYGHSRVSEFVLGGATADVLREPLLPVLLSH